MFFPDKRVRPAATHVAVATSNNACQKYRPEICTGKIKDGIRKQFLCPLCEEGVQFEELYCYCGEDM